METISTLMQMVGVTLWILGGAWLFLLIYEDTMIGAILSLFCGIAAIIFGLRQWPESKVPLIIMLVGNLLAGAGEAMEPRVEYQTIDFGQIEGLEELRDLSSEEITMDDLEGRPAETPAASFDDIPDVADDESGDADSAWDTNDAFGSAPPEDPFGTKPTPVPPDPALNPPVDTVAIALEPAQRLIDTAKLMWEQGRYEAALASAEKALAIYQRNLPPDSQEIRNVQAMIDAAKAQIEK